MIRVMKGGKNKMRQLNKILKNCRKRTIGAIAGIYMTYLVKTTSNKDIEDYCRIQEEKELYQ